MREPSNSDPISLIPEAFLNEKDIKMLDKLFDRVATESRWSNRDVARAFSRMLHYIVGDGDAGASGTR